MKRVVCFLIRVYTLNMIARQNNKFNNKPEMVQNCTCFNLRKATRAVTQIYDEALKPCGLYGTQFTLLAAISNNENATITGLANALIMDRTTLTRNLTPLEKKVWVEITNGEDKRTRVLSLTGSGKKVLKEATVVWEQAQSQVVKVLGKNNWEQLMKSLSLTIKKLNPY
jgi:DNA-binding MarR family transcriptional regulator